MLSAHCGQQVGQRGALPPQAVSNSSFFLQPEHKEPPSLRSPQALPRFPSPGLPFESNQWRHPHPAGRPGSICKTKIEDPPFKSYAAGRPHTPDSHQYSTAKTKWTQKQRVTSPGPWPSGPRPLLLLQEAKMGVSGNQTSPLNCSGKAAPAPGCGQCRHSPPWPGPPVRARGSLVCLDNLCLLGHLSLWPPETNGDKLVEIMVGHWAAPRAHERGAFTSHSGNNVQGGGRMPSGRRSWAWAPGCSGARGKVHIQPAGSPAQSCPQAIQDTGGCPPALGPTCKPRVVTRLKGRLRFLQGEKPDFWSQCGEKHEKTAASSLKNFLKKQGQDIDSRENSLTSSSPATPQRPAYSHKQQAHDKMLNITDHQGCKTASHPSGQTLSKPETSAGKDMGNLRRRGTTAEKARTEVPQGADTELPCDPAISPVRMCPAELRAGTCPVHSNRNTEATQVPVIR